MSDAPAKPLGRPMKFPYTFSAKIAQFPYKFYIQKQWIWRYYLIGVAVSVPVFYKISSMGKILAIIWIFDTLRACKFRRGSKWHTELDGFVSKTLFIDEIEAKYQI